MLSFDRFRCVYHAAESKLSSSDFARVFVRSIQAIFLALCDSRSLQLFIREQQHRQVPLVGAKKLT